MIIYTNKWKIPFEIDDDDYEFVKAFSWYVNGGYVATNTPNKESKTGYRLTYLHILLLGKASEDLEWDHIDRNTMNNKKSNFRLVSHSSNQTNQNNSSGIANIQKHKNRWRVYVPSVRNDYGRAICLGQFKTIEEAKFVKEKFYSKYPGLRNECS